MASRPTRQHLNVAVARAYACVTLKHGHPTRDEALDAAEKMMDAGRVDPGCHLTPYRCDDCGAWHIRNRRIVFLAPADLSRRDYRTDREPD